MREVVKEKLIKQLDEIVAQKTERIGRFIEPGRRDDSFNRKSLPPDESSR